MERIKGDGSSRGGRFIIIFATVAARSVGDLARLTARSATVTSKCAVELWVDHHRAAVHRLPRLHIDGPKQLLVGMRGWKSCCVFESRHHINDSLRLVDYRCCRIAKERPDVRRGI